MMGCSECKFWDHSKGDSYGKNQCMNKKFHKYMKETYHLDSRKWLLAKEYCEFAQGIEPKRAA